MRLGIDRTITRLSRQSAWMSDRMKHQSFIKWWLYSI